MSGRKNLKRSRPSFFGDVVVQRAAKRSRVALKVVRPVRIQKGLRAQLPEEVKFFDTAVAFTPDSTIEVPATGQLALIPQGDTESTRDGRIAIIRSIQFRGQILGPTTASVTQAFSFYMWVILDMQANGAAAAAQGTAGVFTGTQPHNCLINLNTSGRFRILHKEVINTARVGFAAAQATPVANACVWPIEFYKKLNIKMDWNSTAGAITEIMSNNIFLVAGIAPSTVVDDEYTVSGNCRLRFVG